MIRATVLVVEPSPELRRMLEEGLEQQGYAVDSVTSPEDAVARLRARPADLLIADPQTRPAPGVDPLAEVHRAFPDLPTIVMTPEAFDPAVLVAPRPLEVPRRVLRKPFTLRELLALVRAVLESPRRPAAGSRAPEPGSTSE